jgi:hypothetical protein
MRALDELLPRVAQLSADVARRAGSLALSAIRLVAEKVNGRSEDDTWEPTEAARTDPPAYAPPRPSQRPSPRPATPSAAPERPRREGARPRPAAAATTATPPAVSAEPEHVDREAVVVAESADAGAADGPGAQLHVDEPWDGYAEQTAKQVIAALADAEPATLAVVRLYESTHRSRSTVLGAVDKRLAATAG